MNRALVSWALIIAVSAGFASPLEAQNRYKKKPAPKKEETPVPMRSIRIAPVDDSQRLQVKRSARRIDELVEANYRKHKVQPNEMTTDEQFVRRAYLDITGTIPDYKRARIFVRSRLDSKREDLIDDLLEDPGYASNMYNYFADLLRVSDRLSNNVPGQPFAQWVRVCMEQNKPYDQMVYEMLSAEGRIWDNPAAGYILRDSGMPLDAVNNTVRVFLGTQIGCAQCHNHPFDRWTQREFYQMAAFTYGTQTRISARDKKFEGKNIINVLREELKTVDEGYDGGGKYNRILIGNLMEVNDQNRNLVLPHDYAYDDAKPKQKVDMKTIFDPQPVVKAGDTPRVVMARWMTSRENPRFTKTIVNRLWKRAFGVGLIEPVDDMRDDTVASNPELMDFLISEMHRLNFDMKEFMRIVYNTKTYQRQSSPEEFDPAEPYHFPGPVLRRMSPEQVWDSFITLALEDPNKFQREPAELQASLLKVDLASVDAMEVYERDKALRQVTGKYRYAREKQFKHQGLLLVRASELPQPLPPSHFLRQFGQSDRETIEGNSDGGSVPQILQMFNGPLTHLLLDKKSFLVVNVTNQKDLEDAVDTIFLSILARYPTEQERAIANAEYEANRAAGLGNIVWALVNTREFLFVQ
ncbi:MAG: hypothetical protein CMJ47_09455 [Planctomyces sp.]|nr:hypothetical protein [Planctomyces sp.]